MLGTKSLFWAVASCRNHRQERLKLILKEAGKWQNKKNIFIVVLCLHSVCFELCGFSLRIEKWVQLCGESLRQENVKSSTANQLI